MAAVEHLRESVRYALQLRCRPLLWLALAALGAVPLVNLVAVGYYARVAAEMPQTLPPLRPLGRPLVLGLKAAAVMLVYGFFFYLAAMSTLGTLYFAAGWSNPSLILAVPVLMAILAAALGVPIALVVAVKRGVTTALNPANSWRIIRRAGVGEYLAYAATALLFTLAGLYLPILALVISPAALLAVAVALTIASPLMGLTLWRWGGHILQAAGQ